MASNSTGSLASNDTGSLPSNDTGGLLPGQSPPLTIITPTDQSGIVLIATALVLSFSLISLLIRAYIRLGFRQQFSRDDVVCALAMVFAVIQSSIVFVAVTKGFGKTIEDVLPTDLPSLQKALYSSDILYIITIWLAKCSVALFSLRLSPNKAHNLTLKVILVVSTVMTFISIFLVALRCNLADPWIFIDPPCSTDLFVRWQVVAAFDIAIEVALFSAAIYIVHGIQLSLSKKFVVILAFGLRLPVIAPTALRLYYLGKEFSSSDPTLDGVLASVCTQIEMNFAIIAATTPCLRPFMAALSTNYGAPAPTKTSPSGTGTARSNNEFSLSSFSKMSRLGRSDEKGKQASMPTTRWDQSKHHASVISGDQHSMESHESKQMIISKNTEWAVEFEGPNRNTQPTGRPGGPHGSEIHASQSGA